MSGADRQARFRARKAAELQRLRAASRNSTAPAPDWSAGMTPKQLAELNALVPKIRAADERRERAIEMQLQDGRELAMRARLL
jgi:hypothetical protein